MPSMSVVEYSAKFIELARYTLDLIVTEKVWTQRFKNGLLHPLYRVVT